MKVHIYTTNHQEAVDYMDGNIDPPIRFRTAPNKLLFATCCKTRRRASGLTVQVYYDCTMFYCKEGLGCNHPDAKSWWCIKHQRMHGVKTRYWSCKKGSRPTTR